MAHGESDGADGGAGEAVDAANQATEIAGTEVGEDVRGGDAALPWLLGSGWTRRTTMRSFWIGRRGEWWSVAVAMASGGDGDSRVARGRESGEGERGPERERRSRGVEAVFVASRGGRGGCHGEAGGGRRRRACVQHAAASCAGTGRRQEKGARWAGPLGELGRAGKQVSGPGGLSPLFFLFCFSFLFL